MTGFLSNSNKKINWLIFFLLTAPSTLSAANLFANLPLPPRASIWGSTGNNTFGEGDAMIPIVGNANQILLGDIGAKYGDDDAWFASIGFGGRKIFQNFILGGAYIFADYNRSPNANYFTVVNPGFELMTTFWDAHFNAYALVGKKTELMNTFTGTQLGRSNTVFFRGHSEYDQLFNLLEDVGPGVDAEIGYTFSPVSYIEGARVFIGSYYFDPNYTSSITGITAGIEVPLNNKWVRNKGASVEISDSYDNVNHNTFLLTLRLTFGGLDKTIDTNIQNRMLDRIPRHLGNLYNGNGIPSEKALVNAGAKQILNNIWFFNADGTPTLIQGFQSCTYEHPCIGLAQTQIDTINSLAPGANFFFSSGVYNNLPQGSGFSAYHSTNNTNTNLAEGAGFSFYNGQNIFGRTSGFGQAATGNDRPLLNDSVILGGNNNVSDVQIVGNSLLDVFVDNGNVIPFNVGILVGTAANGTININNTAINSSSSTNNVAGLINNSYTANVNINSSTLTTNSFNVPGGVAVGAGNLKAGTLTITGSQVAVTQTSAVNTFNVVFGVVNNENGVVNISGTTINAEGTNAGFVSPVLNNSTIPRGTLNVSDSTLSVVAESCNLVADVVNQANNGAVIGGLVNVTRSSLSLVMNNSVGGLGAAVFNSNGTINFRNSVTQSSGNEGLVLGLFNTDPQSTINFQNNTISVNEFGTAIGAPVLNGGTANDEGGNQCFLNGVAVPCS